jgi:hypothetical protein
MGTMLLVTVPMNCTSTNAPFTTTICTPTNNVFTPGDFIADESGKRLAKAAIVINFFMLAIVVLHYLVIFHRERIMLDLLDSDPTVANDRLAEVLPYYTRLAPVIKWAHSRAFFSSILFFVFFLINTIISGIVIFKCEWRILYFVSFLSVLFVDDRILKQWRAAQLIKLRSRFKRCLPPACSFLSRLLDRPLQRFPDSDNHSLCH